MAGWSPPSSAATRRVCRDSLVSRDTRKPALQATSRVAQRVAGRGQSRGGRCSRERVGCRAGRDVAGLNDTARERPHPAERRRGTAVDHQHLDAGDPVTGEDDGRGRTRRDIGVGVVDDVERDGFRHDAQAKTLRRNATLSSIASCATGVTAFITMNAWIIPS